VIPDPASYPARVNGKLFFVAGDGKNYVCSASVIVSAGQSLIMSAGHCAYDSGHGGWAHDWLFVPAYDEGAAPYGWWISQTAVVPTGWINTTDFAYDVSAITIHPDGAGNTIQSVLGAWGYTFDTDPNQYHEFIGYPEEPTPPYDGGKMIGCNTSFGFWEEGTTGSDGDFSVYPCTMTHGASGGAYVTASGQLQAVNSHGYCDVNGTYCGYNFGTYFGPTALNVYNSLANVTPSPYSPPTPTPTPAPAPTPAPTAPDTFLLRHPSHRTKSHRVRFTFRSNTGGASFQCLFARGWRRCSSPVIFRGLKRGNYVFKVRAVSGGLLDVTPATWRYRVTR
jgi:V8-like Glu-specific endopeptidase